MFFCKIVCGEFMVYFKELNILLKCIYKSLIKCLYEFYLGMYKCNSVWFWVSFFNNDDYYWLGLDWYMFVFVFLIFCYMFWYIVMDFVNLIIYCLLEKCNLYNFLFNLKCIYDCFDLIKFIRFILFWISLKKGIFVFVVFN